MERLTRRSNNGAAIYNTPSADPEKWENNRREVLRKLAEYEDLEEQEKLLKLPCKVGDEVYTFNVAEIIELKVIEISLFSMDRKSIVNVKCLNTDCDCFRNFVKEEFGKTVFLTRAEAEEALRKMNETEGER